MVNENNICLANKFLASYNWGNSCRDNLIEFGFAFVHLTHFLCDFLNPLRRSFLVLTYTGMIHAINPYIFALLQLLRGIIQTVPENPHVVLISGNACTQQV